MMLDGVTLIGPVSRDYVRLPGRAERQQPGGAIFYAGMALRALDVPVEIFTRLAKADEAELLSPLRKAGASVTAMTSAHTTRFTNLYGPGTDDRRQQSASQAGPFVIADLSAVTTQWIYFGPLLQDDISTALIRHFADCKSHRIALDAQGLLRCVKGGAVTPAGWPDRYEILPLIDILKVDMAEAELITGQGNPEMAARILCGRGVDHAIVTLGETGAIVCHRGALIRQPAWRPAGHGAGHGEWPVVDTTGCGDTFLAAYLACVIAGKPAAQAAKLAGIAAALKLTVHGPLQASRADIIQLAGDNF